MPNFARSRVVSWMVAMLTGSATAHAAAQPAAPVYGMSAGRLGALAAMAVAVTSVVLARRARAESSRFAALGGLIAGIVSSAVGAVVIASSSGGVGSGNGRGGAILALLLGLVGTALGGSALARVRSGAREE